MRARAAGAAVAPPPRSGRMAGMPGATSRTLRLALGLAIAAAAVLAAAPPELVPWGRRVHALFQRETWPALPALVSLALLLATRAMPTPRALAGPPAPLRDYTAMAVGLLLLVEPLIHLVVLGWSAGHPSLASAEAVLPIAPAYSVTSGALPAALRILTVSALVPVAEEWFFRGRLLPWLDEAWRGRRWGRAAAVTLSTLAFAAAHGEPVQALFAVPLGLLLAAVRLRAGDLAGCMLAHACHNSLFLFVGPALIGTPWMAPVLATGGAVLIASAWMHHQHPPAPDRHLRAVTLVLGAISLIVLSYPLYRRAQDWLWVHAAHQLVVYWRIDTDALLDRLDAQRRHGRLDAVRRGALYALLEQSPCQRVRGASNPRQAEVLAELDPARLAAAAPEQAYDLLLDLAECHGPCPGVTDAALRIGLRSPEDFAALVTRFPDCLARWLPLPACGDQCLAQLAATTGHHRRMLLTQLEHAFPGQVAAVLLRLRADQVTPVDRRHLFGNYEDAPRLIAQLAATDPERARAWMPAAE
jgi:membrane protease YdiL (CAAX protease family)